ncbi:MAG TPA: TraB/GumN family protein [Sphingobium sp.]|nr:TraB/GumN family protein [Sphingobium sp.]
MKRYKSLLLSILIAVVPLAPALAAPAADTIINPPVEQTAPPVARFVHADPALWVIQDEDTTIYLFGTIHLLRREILWFDGPVRRAFDSAQEVVLEIIDEEGQAGILSSAMQPDAPPLSSQLPGGQGAKFLAALADNGAPAVLFDHVKPWLAAVALTTLPLQKLGYSPESGVDRAIRVEALAAGKALVGLETAAEQMGFFSAMPHDLQLALLSQTIDELPTLPSTIEQMITAWGAGDPDRLGALMNESVNDNPGLRKVLLTERNARWADWIKDRLAMPGTVFIAVGAGHLAGADSVQAMLRMRGIESARVIED